MLILTVNFCPLSVSFGPPCTVLLTFYVDNLQYFGQLLCDIVQLLRRRDSESGLVHPCCPSVCLSVCLSPKCKKNDFLKKTKQFRPAVSIDYL